MASKEVEDAIEAYLQANWSTSPILVENKDAETPDDGSPFILLQFPVSNVSRVSPTNRLYREESAFRIVINVARGEGTSTIRTWGAELADLFRDVTVGPVECLVPTEPFTDDESDQGNYFSGSMVCPYTYYFVD